MFIPRLRNQLGFSGNIQPCCKYCPKTLTFPQLSIARPVLINTAEWTRESLIERKCPGLETPANGIRNRDISIESSAFYRCTTALHICGNELINCGLVFVVWIFQRLAFIDRVCVSRTNKQVRLCASPPQKMLSSLLLLSLFCIFCKGT